jgi:hypothetical protein
MRQLARLLATGGITAALAACTSAAPATPPPATPSPPPSGAPSASGLPSAAPDPATYWLRMTTTQALPPLSVFGTGAVTVITGSGEVVMPGPVPAVFPGPLVVPLVSRPISDAGRARILDLARSLGLLGRQTDFTPGVGLAGGIVAHVELTVDGQRVTISGSPDATASCATPPCVPPSATPEAFGAFWRQLLDLPTLLGAELGAETGYTPTVYSILIGAAPVPDPTLGANVVTWPFDGTIGGFGAAVANGQARCGTVTGAAAATFGAAFAKANALTQWTQNATTSATFGLTVRALVPGEDACREVFGVGQ